MNRYIVYVDKIETARVEIEAEDDASAIEKAKRACFYYQPSISNRIGEAKIMQKGPAGEPLVKLPTEWEIYTSMPGHAAANRAITVAAKKVATAMQKDHKAKHDIGPKLVHSLVNKHIAPVFKKYHDFGTGDTEPRANMASYLSAYAKGLGVERDTCEKIYEEVRWNL